MEIRPLHKYIFKKEIDLASATGQARYIDVVEREDEPGKLYVRKTYSFRGVTNTVSKAQQQLLSEYKILSSLNHPTIVPLVDCEYLPQQRKWEAHLYMEYFQLGDLSQFIPDRLEGSLALPPMTERRFWDISFQLATALLYCHTGIQMYDDFVAVDSNWREPVIHRDIKPQNVLICRIAMDQIGVKLCDFGLARHANSQLSASFVGTQEYLPPEIKSEFCEWSVKSDIYSLGVTLRKVFGTREDVPHIDRFIDQCTSKEPKLRPSTVQLVNLIEQMSHNDRPPGRSLTVAHRAAKSGCDEALRILNNLKEDIFEEDGTGLTLCHVAAANGWKEAIDSLLRLGYDIDARDDGGSSAIHYAAAYNRIEMIAYLQQLGLSLDARTKGGWSTIHAGAFCGDVTVIEFLVKNGQSIDVEDINGSVAMHIAAGEGHIVMVDYLRSLGQSISVKDFGGNTPMHYAAENGQIEMIKHLTELGASIQVENKFHDRPEDEAALHGQVATRPRRRGRTFLGISTSGLNKAKRLKS